ncbi:MAG: PEP-CTERM sorting domain-containing protein [Tepidisphaeraceae bacterium]
MFTRTVSPFAHSGRGVWLVAAVLSVAALPGVGQAAIAGFGDFSGFAINQNDTGAPPTVSIPAGSITLTNTGSNEARSIFATTPQPIGAFTASFTYRATNIGFNFNNYQGAAFVLQTSPAGTAAVGTSAGFGYYGMTSSLGIPIALLNQGDAVTQTTLAKNGSIPALATVDPINAYNGNPIDVVISYNGTLLHEQLKDTVTNAVWSTDYVLSPNLATLLNSSTAYVGFTAGTVAGVNQTISNFKFTNSVPEPASIAMLAAGGLGLLRRRR